MEGERVSHTTDRLAVSGEERAPATFAATLPGATGRLAQLLGGLDGVFAAFEREQAAADARGMTATLTGAGLGRLRDAYPHALASVRTNVIDYLDGFDLAAFAEAVGKFATAETGCHPRRLARRRPVSRGA